MNELEKALKLILEELGDEVKDSSLEQEVKSIVKVPENLKEKGILIEQYYICGPNPEVRVRNKGNKKYYLTIKKELDKFKRIEFEKTINKEDFELLKKISFKYIKKIRVKFEGIEIDFYDDGTIRAEYEFSSNETPEEAKQYLKSIIENKLKGKVIKFENYRNFDIAKTI